MTERRGDKTLKPTHGEVQNRSDPSGSTFQDGLLLLGRADESADAFNDLAL